MFCPFTKSLFDPRPCTGSRFCEGQRFVKASCHKNAENIPLLHIYIHIRHCFPRCAPGSTPTELRKEAARFVDRWGEALVEEFVDGLEVTVLACEDPDNPGKPRVFHPVQVSVTFTES